jgi:hypothetical protein
MTIERLHLARAALLARLPPDGAIGRTSYRPPGESLPLGGLALDPDDADRLAEIAAASETGSIVFEEPARITLVLPPFPVERALDAGVLHTAPLRKLLDRPRAIAVLLLRLGGYSVGFFRGDALIASKTGRRFVKNRHRKGGQSQRRYDRIREKQTDEHFGAACEAAQATLAPYEREIEHVLFGGDRHTLHAFRKQCHYFDRYGDRILARVLPVPGDPRLSHLEAIPRELSSSDLYVAPLAE